jgi:superfamily II DNA or RNA helicase
MQLRDYQLEARDSVLDSQLGQVISPTGTGKSVIQGSIFIDLMTNNKGFGVYAILTPRILLTNH